MAGNRVYVTYFENVTVAAAQDLLSLKAGSVNGVELHQFVITAAGASSPTFLRVQLKRFTGTVSSGSGGSVPTIAATDSGDTKAATAVAHANDTSGMSQTGGSNVLMDAWQWDQIAPLEYNPAPEDRVIIQATEGLSVAMLSTPSSQAMSGFIKWREMP